MSATAEQERTDPPLRFAGLLERYHFTRCQEGFDGCVSVSARYTGHAPLSKSLVYGALKYAIEHEVHLGVQIENPDKPHFIHLPSITLSHVVNIVTEPLSLQDVFSAQLGSPIAYGTDTPLWRLTVLPDDTVLFAYHHAIGDGQSGLAFHHSFLTGLNELLDPVPDTEDVVIVPTSIPMELPTEMLTSTSVSIGTFLHTFFKFLIPASWTAGASAWTGNPVIEQPSLTTNIHLWEISAQDAKAFLRLCKSHNATLTGGLHTIGVLVLSRLIAAIEDAKSYKTIYTSVAVSLRRFTGTSPMAMCDQASAVHSYIPIIRPSPTETPTETFPWHTAARFSDTLRKGLSKTREVIGTIKYLYTLGISKQFFVGKLGKKREATLEFSNVGRFPETEGGATQVKWSISSMYFAQCDSVLGAAMKLNIVGSPSGSVNIAVTWGPAAIGNAIADAFISGFKSELLSLVAQDTAIKDGE